MPGMSDKHPPPPPGLAADYSTARSEFLAAVASAGASVWSSIHPRTGPGGEQLALDVATLGPRDASTTVLVVSGTHGVEGFCGSALQTNWLRRCTADRPDNVRVVLIHALNPYGFAWVRRVNEENIDLNRNFIDWDSPPPHNADYDDLADLLVPESFTEAEQKRTFDTLFSRAMEVGLEQLQAEVSRGQYAHPRGVFYGGATQAWSNDKLETIWADELAGTRSAIVIDLHTGLGPWGHGELIAHDHATTPGYERATALWGQVHSMVDGESVSAALSGDWLGWIEKWAGDTEVTACALEYGTIDPIDVLLALRADAWLHGYGDPLGPAGEEIRGQVRAAFADDDPAWIASCWQRFHEVMGAALNHE